MHNFTRLLIALFISIPMIGSSQIDNIEFLKSEAPYTPLEDGVSLTADFTEEDWEMYYYGIELDDPIQITVGEHNYQFYIIDVNFDGLVFLEGINATTFEEVDFVLAPFDEILDYRYSGGVNENDSEILYHFEDGIHSMEFRNLSFYSDEAIALSPDARFTFRVFIESGSGKVTYHYGPSNYDSSINNILQEIPLFVGLGIETYSEVEDKYKALFGILAGDSDDPELDLLIDYDYEWEELEGLSSLPNEGTVYEFSFSLSTGVNQKAHPLPIQIAPNPGSDYVQILSDHSLIGSISVYVTDMMGRIVMKDVLTESMRLNTSSLSPGMYHLKIVSEQGSATMPWVKQ